MLAIHFTRASHEAQAPAPYLPLRGTCALMPPAPTPLSPRSLTSGKQNLTLSQYPHANGFGCTREMGAVRDAQATNEVYLRHRDLEVVGVSPGKSMKGWTKRSGRWGPAATGRKRRDMAREVGQSNHQVGMDDKRPKEERGAAGGQEHRSTTSPAGWSLRPWLGGTGSRQPWVRDGEVG